MNRDETRIKKINVGIDECDGNNFITKNQVLNFIEENFDVKNKILSGNQLGQIEKAVSVIPQVKSSNAFTDDHGNLNIKIEQRQPLCRVYNLQAESYYVDLDGTKFPVSEYYTAKVPVITGNITERCDSNQKIQSIELKKVFNIIRSFNKNDLWKAMVGQYNINDKSQVELIPRFGNSTILFGDDKNCEQKIKKLDVFYFRVLKKIGWDYYKVINIMYKDQIVCLK
ncbi:MAG: hypothetical protein JWN78_2303 [Bacteroidota bacterium]|nr:hypothetical protein [Bacteroidota bacterium]